MVSKQLYSDESKQPRSVEEKAKKTAFAEIIESNLHGFVAQSWQWNKFPAFGSLVVVESNNKLFFGIVHQVQTGSMDSMRYPFPYQKTESELLREQPQIFEFLKTSFSCFVIGYQEKGKIYWLSGSEPVKIHSFVQPMSKEQALYFFVDDHYLHLLFGFSGQLANLDELLLALLKNMKEMELLTEHKLQLFIETYALLVGNDYRRLKLFLQRVQGVV
jgi:hypothetical protein